MAQTDNWCGISRFFATCADLDECLDSNDSTGHYVTGHPHILRLQASLREAYGLPTLVTIRGLTAIELALSFRTDSAAKTKIACSKFIYPDTRRLLLVLQARQGFGLRWIDPTNQDHLSQPPVAQVIFTETIGNSPLMPVADIPALLQIAEQQNAILIVDATATPQLTIPDNRHVLVIRSLTKYGQGDDSWTGGCLSGSADLMRHMSHSDTCLYPSVCMSHQAARHFTEHLPSTSERYQEHCANTFNAAVICRDSAGIVRNVWYPGLTTHPQHTLLFQQYNNLGGGFLYLQLKGGNAVAHVLCDYLAADHDSDWHIGPSFGSSDWRIFPFTSTRARAYLDAVMPDLPTEGIVRLAPGRQSPEKNLATLCQALEHLLVTT